MKKITLDVDLLGRNKKLVEWHIPSKPPFVVTDEETGETHKGHEVIIENGPSMIKYHPGTAEFSVVTQMPVIVYDYATKERTEV